MARSEPTPGVGVSPLELAAGWIHGRAEPPAPPAGVPREEPIAALEAALVPALERGPCLVGFSGGRDSSLVLAAAARAARRHGLPLPIPSTLRYPALPETDESSWQELVVRHLGLDDWLRIELTDELDCVGAIAQAEIDREGGPFFPANAHSAVPHLTAAAGGTLVMGLGGDELLISHRWRAVNDLLARRRRPDRSDVRLLATLALPHRLRMRGSARELADLPWLRPAARRALGRLLARAPDDPVRYDRAVLQSAATRALRVGVATIARVVEGGGATLATPLLAPRFVHALARAGGARGWGTRTPTMRALAADLLPDAVLARGDKVHFADVFFTETTREFAARWSGEGLDEELVDPAVLRAMWRRPRPDFRSAMLLQAAWAHDHVRVAA